MRITTSKGGPSSSWTIVTGIIAASFTAIADGRSSVKVDPPALVDELIEQEKLTKYMDDTALVALATHLESDFFHGAVIFSAMNLMRRGVPMPWAFEDVIPFDGENYYVPRKDDLMSRHPEGMGVVFDNPKVIQGTIDALEHYFNTGEDGFMKKIKDAKRERAITPDKIEGLLKDLFGGNSGVEVVGSSGLDDMMKKFGIDKTPKLQRLQEILKETDDHARSSAAALKAAATPSAKLSTANSMHKFVQEKLAELSKLMPWMSPIKEFLRVVNPNFFFDENDQAYDFTSKSAEARAALTEIRSTCKSPTLNKVIDGVLNNLTVDYMTNCMSSLQGDNLDKILEELRSSADSSDECSCAQTDQRTREHLESIGVPVREVLNSGCGVSARGDTNGIRAIYGPLLEDATVDALAAISNPLDNFLDNVRGGILFFAADSRGSDDKIISTGIGVVKDAGAAMSLARGLIPAFLNTLEECPEAIKSAVRQQLKRAAEQL